MALQKKIAVIIGSTRTNRVGPAVANHVFDLLKPLAATAGVTLDLIDIVDQKLPLYDEPTHPGGLPKEDPTPHYANDFSRKWSGLVRQYDAYAFVTPEYNGSVPAGLKNALDYLFYEWSGKPAGIVSYGGGGGKKSAAHLEDICKVLRLKSVPTKAAFRTPRDLLPHYLEKKEVTAENLQLWKEAGSDAAAETMFSEILEQLKANENEAAQ
ncbi:hypothetical protein VHEMI03832 [[Torrubiella] hemipterigena]|uniref:NADPH-dependent FMN reductase-like domain-containing protein n=1 Tax=[Torrubiella] hemipterigena TaxID=1531966 RepID=A0A0A1SZJ7_9HYPO|nr:hypothetical protein VHEMI03832 [[Torrubiella] hemipterigena]